MKDKVLKVVLIISSLPFIGILIKGVYAAFFGISIGFFGVETKTYGFDGFWASIVFTSILLIQNAIIPICLIYQLFYLIRHLIKKEKIREKEVDS